MTKPVWFDFKVTLGNVLTAVAMLGTLFAGYINLKLDVASASQRIDIVSRQVDPIDSFETRMAVVERNQVTGKDAREQFQSQISASVEQLRQQNIAILTQLSALVARLDERDRTHQ